MKYLKVTVALLVLVQAFELSLQTPPPPSPTLDKSWLRRQAEDANTIKDGIAEEEKEQENGNDSNSGTSSGAMEDESVFPQWEDVTEETNRLNLTESPAAQNVTVKPTESPRSNVTAPSAAPTPIAPIETNKTQAENDANSKSAPQNATTVEDSSSSGNVTSAPELIPTANPDEELKNSMAMSNATAVTSNMGTDTNDTLTRSPSVSMSPGSTQSTPTTTAAEVKPDESTGDTAGRGSVLDPQRNARQQAWGAVLATAVAVACVGLVAYIILRKKYPKGFSHRKLVEEYPSDPVLRLDNSEPLDLNFGHMGYHNPGVQGDDIQMGRIPRRQN